MYQLEKTDYGVRLTWNGVAQVDEVQHFQTESKRLLPTLKQPWHILVNMVEGKPFPPDAAALLQEVQAYYRSMGMQRSIVIVDSTIMVLQLRRVAKESGILEFERYIAIAKYPNDWEARALDWLRNGVDRTE